LKNKINKNLFDEKEKINKKIYSRKVIYYNYNNNSDIDVDNKPEYNNNNNINDDPRFDNNIFFDFEDDKNNNNTTDKNINRYSYLDNGYNSDRINIIITKNTDKYYTTELDKYG
jgi:hypothetical protein